MRSNVKCISILQRASLLACVFLFIFKALQSMGISCKSAITTLFCVFLCLPFRPSRRRRRCVLQQKNYECMRCSVEGCQECFGIYSAFLQADRHRNVQKPWIDDKQISSRLCICAIMCSRGVALWRQNYYKYNIYSRTLIICCKYQHGIALKIDLTPKYQRIWFS